MIFLEKLFPQRELPFLGLPGHVGDFVQRSQVIFRRTMAAKAPTHGQWLVLAHHLHLIDAAMTGNATDAAIHMGAVVEINKIGKVMHAHPVDRLACFVTVAHRSEFFAGGPNLDVAVHTCLSRRDGGMTGFLNRVVTVTAVESELADMKRVTVRHGLCRRVTDPLSIRVSDADRHGDSVESANAHDRRDDAPDLVRPFREEKFLFFQLSAQ